METAEQILKILKLSYGLKELANFLDNSTQKEFL